MIDRLTISGVHSKRKQFLVSPKITFRGRTRSLCFGGGEVSNMFFTFGLYLYQNVKYEIQYTNHKLHTCLICGT